MSFRKRYRSCNRFAKEKSLSITKILLNIAPNTQVEYSATSLLTDQIKRVPYLFSSAPCHPLSVEQAEVFCYEKMCFMFAPASEWKEDVEWIAHHTHSDLKQYVAHLVCDCSNKPALRKSKQPWRQHRMFLTCYKKECNFFMWIDQPISHGIKERLSYSPQPQVTRFHPYEEIKKRRQEAKQKAFIQHHLYTQI